MVDDLSGSLAAPFKLLTSLAIGLLLGLQRERTPSAKAGLRTFALVAMFGAVCGLLAQAAASAWIAAVGLALVGLMIIAAYHDADGPREADSGTTTVIALLLCYGLGVMVWYDRIQLAVAIGIVTTLLLHFKPELQGFSSRLSRTDLAIILQFAVLSFVILPLLPDRGYGPYGALNPYHIWLMVVLVSGVSLAGYLALHLAGAGKSVLLVGMFGGLVSSTATTLVYARQSAADAAMVPIGGTVVVIANLVVLVRLGAISAAVAPAALPVLLPVLACGLAFGVVPAARRMRALSVPSDLKAPALDNPTQLRVALGFAALYALVLLGSAWLAAQAGRQGLYAIALASGFADVDAITLSSLALFNGEKVKAAVAATAVCLAYASNAGFKLALLYIVGGRPLFHRCAPSFAAAVAGLAAGLALFA